MPFSIIILYSIDLQPRVSREYCLLGKENAKGAQGMQKHLFKCVSLAAMMIVFLLSTAAAQSFFGPSTSPAASPTQAPGLQAQQKPGPNPTMSPDDFKNAVNAQHQQNEAALAQQFKSNPVSVAPPTAPTNTPNSASSNANPSQASPTQQAAAVSKASTTPPAAPPATSSFSINQNSAPTSSTGTRAPASQPTNTGSTYTGFGTGNGNNKTSTPSTGSSSGWNVNY
jgi:hypothetical protein